MAGVSRQKRCRVCGREIPQSSKRRVYCSSECMAEATREKSRIYWHTKGKYHIPAFGNVSLLHQAGYDGLAATVVQLAIEDIRACSLRDIERYMAKGAATAKCMRYLSAKSFLLSQRFTMFCEWSGKDIYNYLIEEKKQKEAKPND